VKIQAGTENGFTLGSPISLFVANQDQRPVDYSGSLFSTITYFILIN
jgi:chorismate synthase